MLLGDHCCFDITGGLAGWDSGKADWTKKCCNNKKAPLIMPVFDTVTDDQMNKVGKIIVDYVQIFLVSAGSEAGDQRTAVHEATYLQEYGVQDNDETGLLCQVSNNTITPTNKAFPKEKEKPVRDLLITSPRADSDQHTVVDGSDNGIRLVCDNYFSWKLELSNTIIILFNFVNIKFLGK